MAKQKPSPQLPVYFKKNLETLPPDKRTEYLNRRLRGVLQHAYRSAPAIREKFETARLKPKDIRTIKDLEALAITEKTDLIELQKKNPPFGGFLGVPIHHLRRIYTSPGPIFEPGEEDYEELGWAQGFVAAGFRPGDIVLNTFSYHMVPFALNMVDNSLHRIGCVTVPTGTGNTEQQIHILRTLRARGFCGTPSFLLTIAEKAEEMGLDCRNDLTLRVAFAAAEMLPESLRTKLEAKFGLVLRQGYGTADIGCLGYECMEKNGMHIPEDKIVEIVDPSTGAQLPPGKPGEIVATTFNRVYPLIRFGTGDLSVLCDTPCPCGRSSPRLLKILGRVDQATKVRGLFIHPVQVDEVVSRHPAVARAQVVVTREEDKDEMTFVVEPREAGMASESLKGEIERSIREVMKLRGEVQFVAPGALLQEGKKIEDKRTWD